MKAGYKIFFFLAGALFLSGCGYTTRGFFNPKYKTIYITPVENNIDITKETEEYSKYRSFPALIENNFTSKIISRFNLDGNLKTTNKNNADLVLKCIIEDFVRDAVDYDDNDQVEKYRLKLKFTYTLFDSQGEVIKTKSITADEDYNLTGAYAKSEDSAVLDLLDDAARRIVDSIVEEW